eukprot:3856108-Pleurochrysis_carterae.AAC.2
MEAQEAYDLHRRAHLLGRRLQHLLDGPGRVVDDEGLLEERVVLVELVHSAGDHLFDDLRRLALVARLLREQVELGLELGRLNRLLAQRARRGGDDVHGDLVGERAQHGGVGRVGGDGDGSARLAHAG